MKENLLAWVAAWSSDSGDAKALDKVRIWCCWGLGFDTYGLWVQDVQAVGCSQLCD